MYPNLDSATRPVPHDSTLLIPVPPADGLDSVEDECVVDFERQDAADVDFDPDIDGDEPKVSTQGELDDLVRDLFLSKEKAKLLASRLKEKNLLAVGVKVSQFRTTIYLGFSPLMDPCATAIMSMVFSKIYPKCIRLVIGASSLIHPRGV